MFAASETVQWIKMLAAKSDNLSSFPGQDTDGGGREVTTVSCPLTSLLIV